MNTELTELVFILDRSGSMRGWRVRQSSDSTEW